ncbi:TVG0679253 [Thermoplasma volcanium GSS1]|uniref:TVG0679253 protein n=1 Tax=Thermoplasma volcanium (strain ATCC 51530 / DSM 4299 / JCM 9571 / NBRC 15438 / GSS1) TaxID=273116 RepID=Q97AY0_THEVO|nr:hypothetical protein [Thermoplasma volcanium]BAB59821.1 TVG0679253 [Thermoplasma volcanium GSS1]
MNTDAIDIFLQQHDLEHLNEDERNNLMQLLKATYPLVILRDRIRTAEMVPNHDRYMRLGYILGHLGYRKEGIWFVYRGSR